MSMPDVAVMETTGDEEDLDLLDCNPDSDVMRYGCGRPRSFAPMRYNETFPPPCPVRLGAVAAPGGVTRALQRRHSWANAQFQRAFDHDDAAATAASGTGLPPRPTRHSYPRNATRHSSVDSTSSREDVQPSSATPGPAVSPNSSGPNTRPAASPSRRSKLLRMGSSLDSSVRNSSAVIANKMRQVCDKLRQHAIQQSTHWPPPSAIFGERYMVADSHPFLAAGGRSFSNDKSQSAASTPARSRRSYPPRANLGLRRRQSSESDSVYSSDAGDSTHGGIVCSELDLKAILSDYKGTGSACPGGGGGVEKAGSSSGFFSLGCATPGAEEHSGRTASEGRLAERSRSFTFASHKRRHFRKQVSFDDRDYYIYHSERKVSAIQEEIELAAMQATQGAASRCASKLSIGEPSVDEASPEEDDRGDENRPLLSDAFAGGSQSIDAPDDEPPSPLPEVAEAPEKPRPQQPKEVEFDEHGQTWEIYGAEFDPNILGQAIQSHLDTIIKKDLSSVFSDIDADEESGSRDSLDRSSAGKERRKRSPATSTSEQLLSSADDSTGLVANAEAPRSRITRLCAILFCVRSRRRPPRKAMR